MGDRKATKAEVQALVNGILEKPPRPKVVVKEGEVIRDADPQVPRADPNYPASEAGVVRVRRSDFVTIRMDLWEEQQREKREDRLRRRALDPARTGIWGPLDDDE